MKTKFIMIAFILLSLNEVFGQSTTATNLQIGLQTRFLGYTNNFRINFRTNNITRMTLMQTNPVGSITGSLGLGIALPNAYLHLSNFGTGVFDPQGRMFRTDGLNSIVNSWSLRTGTTAANSIERFRIYVPANSSNVGIYSREDLFFTNGGGTIERMRILEPSGNVGIGIATIPNNIRIRTIANSINQLNTNWNKLQFVHSI